MDSQDSSAGAQPDTSEAPQLGFFQRLIGMYFEPRKTFEDINRKGAWMIVFLMISVLTISSAYVVVTRVPQETMIRKGLEANPFTKNIPEEQKERIIADSAKRTWQRYLNLAFIPVGVILVYLVCAGVLLLIYVLMGTSLTFKNSLAVTVWAMAPPSIIHLILTIVMVSVKDPDTLDVFNAGNNVISNLGPLVDEKAHAVLNTLLSSVDFFSFWTIFLLAVGFSTASKGKLRLGQALTGILIPWALWVGVKTGYYAIFG